MRRQRDKLSWPDVMGSLWLIFLAAVGAAMVVLAAVAAYSVIALFL